MTSPLFAALGRDRNPGTVLMRGVGAGLFLMILLSRVCTQYVAHRLGYRNALGEPILSIGAWRLCTPLTWLGWYVRYRSVDSAVVTAAFRLADAARLQWRRWFKRRRFASAGFDDTTAFTSASFRYRHEQPGVASNQAQ